MQMLMVSEGERELLHMRVPLIHPISKFGVFEANRGVESTANNNVRATY